MQAQEGRLFSPCIYRHLRAMGAAAILSITLVPVMMGIFFGGKIVSEHANPVNWLMHAIHANADAFHEYRWITIWCALVVWWLPLIRIAGSVASLCRHWMKAIFCICHLISRYLHHQSKELLQQTDRIILTFPEVHLSSARSVALRQPRMAPLSMFENHYSTEAERTNGLILTNDQRTHE